MLKKNDSLELADKALQEILALWPEELHAEYDAYSNGREQGYSIYSVRPLFKRVSFGRDRNSDSLVLYAGEFHEFQMGGNVPTNIPWKNRTYLSNPKDLAIVVVSYFISTAEV